MSTFANFELPSPLVESLERLKITTPTPVQQETLPVALTGGDLLASAQTGSGKTIAYLIPLIMKLIQDPAAQALILAPTRELAMQVHQTLHKILPLTHPFKSALLIGGAPMFKQLQDLKRHPRVIVGTPGRITDHLERRSLSLDKTCFLVIDEADRMLDMGFGVQLDRIAEYLPENRQTLMFSATLPPNIQKLSQKYLRNPTRITIGATHQAAPKIQQEAVHTSPSEKTSLLIQHLESREGSIIVFVKTKRKAENLSKELRELGHAIDAMHGDLPQRRREQVIRGFRNGKHRILVATDVAARGLDIPHVMHVINYDLPESPEDYVHRIGRTGRAGAEGFAVSFISTEERYKWKAIDRLLNPQSAASRESEPRSPRPPFRDRKPFKSRFSGAPRSESNRNGHRSDKSFGFHRNDRYAEKSPKWNREPRRSERAGNAFDSGDKPAFRSGRPEKKKFNFSPSFGQEKRSFKKFSSGTFEPSKRSS